MAKRKKHRKKKQAQSTQPVQTSNQAQPQTHTNSIVTEPKEVKTSVPDVAEAGSAAEVVYVKNDVRYSLILIGIILLVFVSLYLLLQNPTVSAKVYGLIKLPNIGN